MGVVALVWGAQVGTLLAVLVAAAVGGTAGRVLLAGARDALVTAFVTGSSAATLPVEWRVAEERLAVPPALAALLVPAGSLVSKVGTTTFLSALAVVALRAGGPVEPLAWLLAVLGAVVLGAVTPPVSGGGLVMLGVLTTWVGADPGLAPVLIAIPFVGKLNTPLNVLARLAVVTRCVR
jgi:Na+/H+-dicarboxylate symporter